MSGKLLLLFVYVHVSIIPYNCLHFSTITAIQTILDILFALHEFEEHLVYFRIGVTE